ncbi:MAG: DNA topoisomerase I [Chloroflexi bacterium]|nr:DNA topoisomerase I [Chloroflexota bacterium]MBU1751952.1 DNA topoisomerase I [Chloroflexota bacterium]
MLKQLIHNGVVVPPPPQPVGLVLTIRGRSVALDAAQEEMALAWAKKHDTPYVQDPVFEQNFMADFSQALGIEPPLAAAEVDFGPGIRIIEAERAYKASLDKEDRKALAAERKALREALREQYGYARVDGERVELANYVVEPSGIFMGRGEHPLRGRWKEGARRSDITLNLSPEALSALPNATEWAQVVWQPESLWVARWSDKLSGKLKYVWLGDTASIKQEREAQKFDQAHELHANLAEVRRRIESDLNRTDPAQATEANPKRRMIATACYLIDALCLRVGDEKDEDEADTVGATTLRPEHVALHENGTAEFEFLGKDSVLWHKTLELPGVVRRNLERLIQDARPSNASANTRDKPQLFPDISSRNVNAYLSEVMPGLTAKVFRTHHATIAVQHTLAQSGVQASDPEHVKWKAASLANLEAAQLCNHTKKAPASWQRGQQRYAERLLKAADRIRSAEAKVQDARQAVAALQEEARDKQAAATESQREKVGARYQKRTASAERRLAQAEEQLNKAELAHNKIEAQALIAAEKRTWNLGTSLKSYIDPRVYHAWGRQVDYDVLESYYPTALRRRFAWARGADED